MDNCLECSNGEVCDEHYECSQCGKAHGASVLDCPVYGGCIYVEDSCATCECKECMSAARGRDRE